MKTRIVSGPLLLVAFLAGVFAGTNVFGQTVPLWTVEGGKTRVWLLGSVHFLKATDYPLPAPIEAAYNKAEVVVFETDMRALQSPDVQFRLMSKARLPEGERLKDHLSAEIYDDLMDHASRAGLPAFLVESLKPSMAATMIVAAELVRIGFDPGQGVDQHFFNRCEADEKEIVGLETVEFQIDLLTDFTPEEAEVFVKTTLEEFGTIRAMFTELVEAWRQGDTANLDQWLNEAKKEAPSIMKRLLTDRNQQWVPKITELAQGDKPVLVVVGAGHLVGKDSVVELLEKRGLKTAQQ